ncbi:hypothetical protein DSO57_1002937 [Entomophthora muscae]|uniref:Uncharacterized protein n=1 Tax=Entomophthora muscae TaxID=34485 RepID=A0ACC2T9A8_9FUNG|nr:hypothetical protein DSO57_1002937 [Entomophthora muscae]
MIKRASTSSRYYFGIIKFSPTPTETPTSPVCLDGHVRQDYYTSADRIPPIMDDRIQDWAHPEVCGTESQQAHAYTGCAETLQFYMDITDLVT